MVTSPRFRGPSACSGQSVSGVASFVVVSVVVVVVVVDKNVDANNLLSSNTTAIAEAWARLDHKFDLMYAKRAFVHW